MKRKVLIATTAVWAIALNPLAQCFWMPPAYAQDAAVPPAPASLTPAPAAEMPPPSGEVLAPATTTISAEAPAAVPPPANAAGASRVKTASVKRGGKDNNADSSSPFGGFENVSNRGPTNINSDTMSFDYKKNIVLFSGHVHAVQAGNELSTDTLHVRMNKNSQIQEMIADGNVRMSQGQRWTTSDHAVLDETLHTLVLTGNPVAHDGKDQIAGTKITVFLQTNTSEVTNPKAVIFPRESKKPDNGEASAAVLDQVGADQ